MTGAMPLTSAVDRRQPIHRAAGRTLPDAQGAQETAAFLR